MSVQPRDWKIGEIAVFNKIVTQAQVDECLEIQAMLAEIDFRVRLGKILIEKFYIDRITLAALLRAQATQRGVPPAKVDTTVDIIKFTPTEHETLVDRVRERKLIQPEALDGCIEIQFALDERGIDKQLGEICIEKGILARSIVSDILARHETMRRSLVQTVVPEKAEAEPETSDDSGLFQTLRGRIESKTIRMSQELRFGRLVQEKGLATDKDVEECLYIQFRLKEVGVIKRIGEVLVMKGLLREPDVLRILQAQKQKMGRVAWSSFGQANEMEPADARLAKTLLEYGLLDQDALGECRFVQKALRDLGVSWTLMQIVMEKGYLDRKMVERLQREERVHTARLQRVGASVEAALDDLLHQG